MFAEVVDEVGEENEFVGDDKLGGEELGFGVDGAVSLKFESLWSSKITPSLLK